MTFADATYFHDHTYRRTNMSHRKHLFPQTSNKQAKSCHVGCACNQLPPRGCRFRQTPFVTCGKRLHRKLHQKAAAQC